MRELLITQQKYLKLPEELNKFPQYSPKIEKLALHHCSNAQVIIDDKTWPNLRYLEIIGCKYLTLSFVGSSESILNQIYFSNVEYIDIGDFIGNFPQFQRWLIVDSRYIKFKGDFLGDIHLELLEFRNTLRSEIFHGKMKLKNLRAIRFLQGCHFCVINLDTLMDSPLSQLWFQDSNYLNIKSLGNAAKSLRSFKFENCAYPKLNVDFSKLNKTPERPEDVKMERYIELLSQNLPFPFRSASKKKPVSPRKHENSFTPEEYSIFQETPPIEKVIDSAQEFLHETTQIGDEIEDTSLQDNKFCPDCGTPNELSAKFCHKCGFPFPF